MTHLRVTRKPFAQNAHSLAVGHAASTPIGTAEPADTRQQAK
jgi:hypothetical protein